MKPLQKSSQGKSQVIIIILWIIALIVADQAHAQKTQPVKVKETTVTKPSATITYPVAQVSKTKPIQSTSLNTCIIKKTSDEKQPEKPVSNAAVNKMPQVKPVTGSNSNSQGNLLKLFDSKQKTSSNSNSTDRSPAVPKPKKTSDYNVVLTADGGNTQPPRSTTNTGNNSRSNLLDLFTRNNQNVNTGTNNNTIQTGNTSPVTDNSIESSGTSSQEPPVPSQPGVIDGSVPTQDPNLTNQPGIIDSNVPSEEIVNAIMQGGSTGQYKLLNKHIVFDSASGSIRIYGQELLNTGDVIGILKNKLLSPRKTTAPVSDQPATQFSNTTIVTPVNANDLQGSTILSTEDITSEVENAFKVLRENDATVMAMDKKLVANGFIATGTYLGKQVNYMLADGTKKILILCFQKYQKETGEKTCIAHVEVAAAGAANTFTSSACFSTTEIPNEIKLLYVLDCFGMLITPGANAQPCGNDFNWEGLKSGVANFF